MKDFGYFKLASYLYSAFIITNLVIGFMDVESILVHYSILICTVILVYILLLGLFYRPSENTFKDYAEYNIDVNKNNITILVYFFLINILLNLALTLFTSVLSKSWTFSLTFIENSFIISAITLGIMVVFSQLYYFIYYKNKMDFNPQKINKIEPTITSANFSKGKNNE